MERNIAESGDFERMCGEMKCTCSVSGKEFEITNEDLKYYARLNVPPPTLCLDERFRRKFAFRNERNLYRRNCDLCGRSMISVYSPDKKNLVYCQECWWGDGWDRCQYGRDFDFSRPFFEQFQNLLEEMPRLCITNSKSDNSQYTNFSERNKNSFFLVGAGENEDCLYSYRIFHCRDVCDCSLVNYSELCYECLQCDHLYESTFCQRCSNSRNLSFCFDCRSCEHCWGCNNLVGKKYYIHNQSYSPEEYFKKIKEISEGWESIKEIRKHAIARAPYMIQCEDSTGDDLVKTKHCRYCFDQTESEDCAYCLCGIGSRDCVDSLFSDNCELCYESSSLEGNYEVIFSFLIWYCNSVWYSMQSFYSSDLFGCVGLNRAKYCILNKEYSQDEYHTLRTKIMEYMRQTGEWGEFFPVKISPFGYNETMAQDHFSLEKAEVLKRGWKWHNFTEDESVLNSDKKNILSCQLCNKQYLLQKSELTFYKKMNLEIPQICPACRHLKRMDMRNPRKLFARKCEKCKTEIQTTFAPDSPEKVYCERCYLQEVQ